MKERLSDDEEDDANIPEEEHQADLELQKPQVKLINRQHSQSIESQLKGTINGEMSREEKEQKVRKIVEEVKKQGMRQQ